MELLKKGTIIEVKYQIGETALKVLEAVKTNDEKRLYRLKKTAYLDGNKCKDGYYHLRQARELEKGRKISKKKGVKFWPLLRNALIDENVKKIHVLGDYQGDCIPIHYTDELVIPDFTVNGSNYFVVPKDKIDGYLERYRQKNVK